MEPTTLTARWEKLRHEEPKLRVRDAAARLGVSEAELVAASGAFALRRPLGDVLADLPQVGRVMALTRNESCVHERKGIYSELRRDGHAALVLGPDIDLRLFLNRWTVGYAVAGERPSLQFFDAAGTAVHKVHAVDGTDATAWAALIERHADPAAPAFVPRALPVAAADRPDAAIDLASLRDGWAALQDTHEFFGLLRRHECGRLQALRLVGAPFATPVAADATAALLHGASGSGTPIMVFVGNHGCIQIHTGPVTRVAPMGPWLNVLDADFNLHLRQDRIASAWVVRKPTSDGTVTSLELYDGDASLVAQFFGARKPGQPELPAWRDLVGGIEGRA